MATPASAQQPLAGWTGAIRCDIQAQAAGYSHQETQTWTLTGAAPTVQGSVTVYPATWSVVGQGWLDQTRNATRRVAQWTANVPPVNAPIGFTLHALGRDFDVAKWHAQLTERISYVGTDLFIIGGAPQASQRLEMTVYEWQFPKIDAAITQTQLTGSQTAQVKAFVGPLQPGEALATVTCIWSLGRGSAPALPASTLPPQTPPPALGGTVSGGAAPGGGAPAGGGAAQGGRRGGGTAGAGVLGALSADLSVKIGPYEPTVVTATPNSTFWYTVMLTNNGPGAANGATIRVPTTPGLSWTSANCYGLSYQDNGAQCGFGEATASELQSGVAIERLPAGDRAGINILVTVTGAVGSEINVKATVAPPAGVNDPNPGNNSAGHTLPVVAPPTGGN